MKLMKIAKGLFLMDFKRGGEMGMSNWRDDPATEKQLAYIMEMYEFSEYPIPPFVGKTKGEASDYIDKYAKRAHERVLCRDDYGDSV